jgi:D-3-phosphoglycerate dehydrogenase
MQVIGYDPNITVQRAWQLSASVQKALSLDDLFSRVDILTLHVPLLEATANLVSRERLKLMPRKSILLNFARNGIVDDEAVMEALDEGRLTHYVSDFPTGKLIAHSKVICLPHLGASTSEAEENCAVMVAENVKEFLENGNVRHSVNFPETVLERTRPHRLAIPHANKPNMVAQILTNVAAQNLNIADLLNHSRGDLSYTIVDLDEAPNSDTVERIQAIDGILSARVMPIIET